MTTIKAFITRRAAATYFALTFTISWGGLLLIGGSSGTTGTTWQSDPRLPLLVMAMLAGPSIAGLLLTWLVSGQAGLREVRSRLLRWRVGVRWYAVALLTAPVVFTAVYLALSLSSPELLPSLPAVGDKATFLLAAAAGALAVGFFEELGWTGFAIPRLLRRYSVLAVGLLVGVPWGAWHLLTNDIWIASAFAGELPVALFLTVNGLGLLAGQLPAYRVLMLWVYDRTGSLLVAMLMHASLSACTFMFGLSVTGLAFLTHVFVMAVAWWLVVAVVVLAQRGQLLRQPLRRAA
jgi:membrane protease YdiL (CAAX protease family)